MKVKKNKIKESFEKVTWFNLGITEFQFIYTIKFIMHAYIITIGRSL